MRLRDIDRPGCYGATRAAASTLETNKQTNGGAQRPTTSRHGRN